VRLLGIVPAIMFAFVMAQASPAARSKRGRADAGPRADAGERPLLLGTDPPGRLRPALPPPDGGSSADHDDSQLTEVLGVERCCAELRVVYIGRRRWIHKLQL